MQYQQALAILSSLGPELRTGKALSPGKERRKFSLDHIRTLLGELREPQRGFPSVLIAGTNGKGSTAATLASVGTGAGLRTGLYTSPHLSRLNERICVDGREILDGDFGRIFGRVYVCAQELVEGGRLPHLPSFFEFVTAVCFLYFAEQNVQLAVLEVGLGGRLDATNVVEPIVSVITDIGIDHTEFLGSNLSEIAREKAGILRKNGVLVTLSQHPEANAVIGEVAMALEVRGVDAARFLPPRGFTGLDLGKGSGTGVGPEVSPLSTNGYPVSVDGEIFTLRSPLAGQHQQRNVALAVATAVELRANHGFAISNAAIEAGVAQTRWPGRLEWIPADPGATPPHAPLLLDVAHNPAGAWTLRAALGQLPEERPRTLIFSCLADKDIREMASILFPLFDSASGDPARRRDHIVLAPIPNPRAATVDELLAAAHALDVPAHAAPHLAGALHQAQTITPADGLIVATGSVYLVGALRALVLGESPAADGAV